MYNKLKNVRFILQYFGVLVPILLLALTFSPFTENFSVTMLLIIIIVFTLISTIYSFIVVRDITDNLESENKKKWYKLTPINNTK